MKTLFLLALLVISAASQSCDESGGWYELNGYCYRVSRSAPETQMTWLEARAACMSEGGDLASIHSEAEQTFIITLAENIGLVGPHLWVGMNHLENRAGTFSWSDGTATSWTNWAASQPKSGGLTMCAYSVTEPGPGPFEFYPYTSALYGLINPDYDWPSEADGIYTFYFGQNYGWTYLDCQSMCEANPRCAAATFWDYHYYYYWDHVCMGRSDDFNALGPDSYASSGVRQLAGGDTVGWWYSANCGLNNGLACKKQVGSDTPIEMTPPPVVDSYCPDGYFSADRGTGNKCFRIVGIPSETQGFRWEQAALLCRSGAGVRPDIATIENEEQAALITSKIQDYGWGYWIGLHYTGVHNEWVWADNSEPSYYNWATGHPVGDDPCVEVYSLSGPAGRWGNQLCDQRRGYICQTYKDSDNTVPTPAVTTPHNCEAGWTPYWYGCYQFQSEPRTWQAAKDYCESVGSSLVGIHAEPENAAVFYGSEGNQPFWIGLSKNPESGDYMWADGWVRYYTNFDDGGMENGEGCVVMKSNAKWNDTQCSASYPSVCKTTEQPPPTIDPPDGSHCPVDWVKFGFKCYYFSSTTDDFTGALTDCRVRGASINADLVTIETPQENHFVYSTLKGRSQYVYSAWIGLYRNPADSDFSWVSGADADFRSWAPGEPSNPINELCVEMDVNWLNVYPSSWYDDICSSFEYYVCEGEQGPEPTYPTIPTAAPGECPSVPFDWYKYGSDCYLARPVEYHTWHGALDRCKYYTGGMGSLVTIHDIEENAYMRFLAETATPDGTYPDPSIWIGLSKQGLGYPYTWESEEEVEFTFWAPGEPNDIDGTQNCVRMYVFHTNGMWDDYFCHDSAGHGYICKTPQGAYAHLDVQEDYFAEQDEQDRKQALQNIKAKPDILVEDSPKETDTSKIVLGSILGLVTLCVISIAIVFAVFKKRQIADKEQGPTFENPLSRERQADTSDVEQQNTQL